jgi:hypothetical protein
LQISISFRVSLHSFIDSKLNRYLGFDGIGEAVLYAIAVGYPAES